MTAVSPYLGFLPTFDSVDEERLHRKQRLAASFRLFGKFGFDEGVAGHITVRDPEHLDRFWLNPFGMNFKHIRVLRPDLCRPHRRSGRRRRDGQPRCVRDPLAGACGASRRDRGRPLALAVRQGLVLLGSPPRSDHAGRVRVLRRPRALRRLHRRGARPRRGQADRCRARRHQGGDPPQSRTPHGRTVRRCRGLVVHHHGAELPGAAARRSRGNARAHRCRHGAQDLRGRSDRRWRAGSHSSRSTP